MIEVADLAYVAALIDTIGGVRTRTVGDTVLPYVYAHGKIEYLTALGELTGTKVIETRRTYSRAGCTQHCPEAHQHIVSRSGRWSVTGVKATVVLWNIRPYLRIHADAARTGIVIGTAAPFKPATPLKMRALGWHIPDVWAVGSKDG